MPIFNILISKEILTTLNPTQQKSPDDKIPSKYPQILCRER